ncbi:RHS repeat-associated core domain-containing protein [Pseudomonas sp. Lb2C1-1]|uniref:RHS repeat-associated core domain-containing protein n=1 Tax=Pseudomonas TaxID=286 RepID=UPI00391CAF5F
MSPSSMKILCRYQYDPLDRLTGLKPPECLSTQRFYKESELVNEIEGQVQLTILRHEAQPLAQRLSIANVAETTLLATDQQDSVLHTLTATDTQHLAYTAYGHQPAESGLSSLLGFNGERPDPITGHYLLGQGNRAFNPVLMRFNSPDELSPFGDGGINPYAYCGGNPINWYDPSGNGALSVFKKRVRISIEIVYESVLTPRRESLPSRTVSQTISQSASEPMPGPSSEIRELLKKPSASRPASSVSTSRQKPAGSAPKRLKKVPPQNIDPTRQQKFRKNLDEGVLIWEALRPSLDQYADSTFRVRHQQALDEFNKFKKSRTHTPNTQEQKRKYDKLRYREEYNRKAAMRSAVENYAKEIRGQRPQ